MKMNDNLLKQKRNRIIIGLVLIVILIGGVFIVKSIFGNSSKKLAPFSINTVFEYDTKPVTEEDIISRIKIVDDNNNLVPFTIKGFEPGQFDRSQVTIRFSEEQFELVRKRKELSDLDISFEQDWEFYNGLKSEDVEAPKVEITIQGDGFTQVVEINFLVVDTQAPVFEDVVEDFELDTVHEVSLTFPKASDPVDGEVETEVYWDIQQGVPGTYPVRLVARDRNENQTVQEFTITIVETGEVITD